MRSGKGAFSAVDEGTSERHWIVNQIGDAMATRKKANAVEPAIEQTREQPVIANDAPTLPVPSLKFAPASLERPIVSSVRPSSKGSKGGAKSGGGKGASGKTVRVGGGGHSQKPKKKKALKGYSLGGRKSEPRKITTKTGLRKRGPSKSR